MDFLSVGLRSIRAVPTPEIRRRDADACPGALRLHAAADGPLARVRLPGGMLTGTQLTVLRELAETWGDGHVELTSRANVQLRALKTAPAAGLAARLWAAGLLPSQTHELVRNIAASPFAEPPARALVDDLDRALCADPELAALPGRFLFAVDDGPGDVAAAADVAAVALAPRSVSATASPASPALPPPGTPPCPSVLPPGTPPSPALPPPGTPPSTSLPPPDTPPSTSEFPPDTPPSGVFSGAGEAESAADGAGAGDGFAIVFAGVDVGLRVSQDRVVAALLAAAHGFLDERAASDEAAAWRLCELTDGPARVASRTASVPGIRLDATATPGTQPDTATTPGTQPDPATTPGTQPDPATTPGTQPDPATTPGTQPDAGPTARIRPGTGTTSRLAAAGVGLRASAGIVDQMNGREAVSALVRLGRLDRVQMEALEKAELLVVTPWRGVVVPDLTPQAARDWLRRLADAGFEVSAGSRWSGVTACAGQPGCAKALADVRADAASVVSSEVDGQDVVRLPVHWVGCARGCGSPSDPHVRVEATSSGYTVTGVGTTPDPAGADGVTGCGADELAALVASARRT
jgi:precorrin-3B synthase